MAPLYDETDKRRTNTIILIKEKLRIIEIIIDTSGRTRSRP
jgi:hypothetical protein